MNRALAFRAPTPMPVSFRPTPAAPAREESSQKKQLTRISYLRVSIRYPRFPNTSLSRNWGLNVTKPSVSRVSAWLKKPDEERNAAAPASSPP